MIDKALAPIPLIDLRRQYASIKDEVHEAIEQVFSRGNFAAGGEVAAFEKEFAEYCGVRHCVAVNSGTSALHLAMIAAGIRSGDEVITASFTFVATAWAVSYVQATPVFVDIELDTCTIDADKVARSVGPNTRAILPIHLYGQMADVERLAETGRRHELLLIEDAAQAQGAEYGGRRAGEVGHIGCFSFYPTKNLGACGEAGALTTNDDAIAARLRHLRDHGQIEKYRHEELAYNYRMDELQGALLRVKLAHLDAWNSARSAIANQYLDRLAGAPIVLPSEARHRKHVWHQFVIRAKNRDTLREKLAGAAIATGLHYPIPLHLQPAYRHLGYSVGDFPMAEQLAKECLSLPMFPELHQTEVDRVCRAIIAAV